MSDTASPAPAKRALRAAKKVAAPPDGRFLTNKVTIELTPDAIGILLLIMSTQRLDPTAPDFEATAVLMQEIITALAPRK